MLHGYGARIVHPTLFKATITWFMVELETVGLELFSSLD